MATPNNSIQKEAVLHLLRSGLVTYAEAAALSGQSRQLIRHWAKELPGGEREALLQQQWALAQQMVAAGRR